MRLSWLLVLLMARPVVARESIKLPVTRDAWFSNVGAEADGSNGGAAQLKIKSHQEMSLLDVDSAPLKGRVIRDATLHLHRSGAANLLRVTVGTFGSDWYEGTASGYEKQVGSSTFKHKKHPDVPWTVAGSDLCAVILSNGGTTWHSADATPPDADGWQTVPVAPEILGAHVVGVSEGLFLFDDTGTEWKRDGEKYTSEHMPNRYVHSRDSNRRFAPFLSVTLGGRDGEPPVAVTELRSETGDLPAGEAWVSWVEPKDVGLAGVAGFFVRCNGKGLPRYLVPRAEGTGKRVKMHLRDLALAPAAIANIEVQAVDLAGNRGPWTALGVKVSDRLAQALPGKAPTVAQGARSPLPKLGEADVAVLDELDKVQPITQQLIPAQSAGYLATNHLWEAGTRTIRLHSARNEFVSFQALIQGGADVEPSLTFDDPAIAVSFGHYAPVSTKIGPLPDPILPWNASGWKVAGAKSQSMHTEVYVGHRVKVGDHRGKLLLKADGHELSLDVVLRVWDFTLPDQLSFLPEMNCYGLPGNERDYYRLAHRHRTYLNRVPYSQRGDVTEGCAPVWDGKRLDWSRWDARFGPYFDGSAFADLPRAGVPIEGFYLPIHENWPTLIEPNYNGSYWADKAFSPAYRKNLVEVSRQFAEHINGKGWDDTLFQFFLNGKSDFKRNGWSRGSSPWILDEPSGFQDFWALRYFGQAWREGVDRVSGRAKLVFRADISRPQWQRDTLDGLLDYNVTSSAFRPYNRIVLDRKAADGQFVIEYGSSNAVEESNVQPVGWSIDAWSLGSDGVLPWQTVGNGDSWKRADTLSLFYPSRDGKEPGPIPSIRLKAYRRGQQDVEYLTLLAKETGQPRWAVGEKVRLELKLAGERKGTGFAGGEDAGVITYSRLTPQALWALRQRVGGYLSDRHPAPRRRVVELWTPRGER